MASVFRASDLPGGATRYGDFIRSRPQTVASLADDAAEAARPENLSNVSAALKQLQELNPERANKFMKDSNLTPHMRATVSHDCGVAQSAGNLRQAYNTAMASHGTDKVGRHGMGWLPGQIALQSIHDSELSDRGKQEAAASLPISAARKWQILQDHRRVAGMRGIDHCYDAAIEKRPYC